MISIIALLIALLLPALQAARDIARQIQCQSNLRQAHLVHMVYAEDHDGRLPAQWDGGRTWLGQLEDGGYGQGRTNRDQLRYCTEYKPDFSLGPWTVSYGRAHYGDYSDPPINYSSDPLVNLFMRWERLPPENLLLLDSAWEHGGSPHSSGSVLDPYYFATDAYPATGNQLAHGRWHRGGTSAPVMRVDGSGLAMDKAQANEAGFVSRNPYELP